MKSNAIGLLAAFWIWVLFWSSGADLTVRGMAIAEVIFLSSFLGFLAGFAHHIYKGGK